MKAKLISVDSKDSKGSLRKKAKPLLEARKDSYYTYSQLLDFLRSDRVEMVAFAAKRLAGMGDISAVGEIQKKLVEAKRNNEKREVIRALEKALLDLGPKYGVDKLINDLEYGNSDLRRMSAIALGKIGDKKATSHLIKALGEDDDDEVCFHMIGALKRLNALNKAIEYWRGQLSGREDSKAISALTVMGPRCIDTFLEEMKDAKKGDRSYLLDSISRIRRGVRRKKVIKELLEKIIEDKEFEDIKKEASEKLEELKAIMRC